MGAWRTPSNTSSPLRRQANPAVAVSQPGNRQDDGSPQNADYRRAESALHTLLMDNLSGDISTGTGTAVCAP